MSVTSSPGRPADIVTRRRPASSPVAAVDVPVAAAEPGATGAGTVLLRVVRAELIKAFSVRSTAIALGIAALFILGLGVVTTLGAVSDGALPAEEGAAALEPLDAPLGGIGSGLWAVVAFGVLVVTSEYSSRSIRTTLAAVPRRGTLVLGKAIAVAVTTLAVVLPTTALTYLAGRIILDTAGVPSTVPGADAARIVLGASLYLVVVALVSSGLAWLLRSTAGAVSAVVGLLVLLPALATLLPAQVFGALAPYLPDAGVVVYQSAPVIAPWGGLVTFAGYAVVLLAAGAALLRRRDA